MALCADFWFNLIQMRSEQKKLAHEHFQNDSFGVWNDFNWKSSLYSENSAPITLSFSAIMPSSAYHLYTFLLSEAL